MPFIVRLNGLFFLIVGVKFATIVTIWIFHRNLPDIPQLVTSYVKN